jgi:glutathione synthase/RimK-type ligase-like ATP-grasp enzyme
MNRQVKIAVFFGGKISQHLVMLKKAAKKLGVRLDLVSYNRIYFETDEGRVKIRQNLSKLEGKEIKNEGWLQINDYDVLFFRTTGKHWEEVDLILRQAQDHQVIVDPIVKLGKPSMACKAYQMLALKEAGIEVPRTIYGSLWYLYEVMKNGGLLPHNLLEVKTPPLQRPSEHLPLTREVELGLKSHFDFPVIIKGSGGDRGTRVFKANNLEELEKLVRTLRKSETEEGKRYMLQEYIENDGDYRVLVLGKKVLGVMKRSSQSKEEFRNNYSAGGTVEVADLPTEIKELAVKAADVCGLWVAGVDIMPRSLKSRHHFSSSGESATQVQCRFEKDDLNLSNNTKDYVILEVNKGPQFKGFMKATGIDVPAEMVKFLKSLSPISTEISSEYLPLRKGRKSNN